MTGAGSPDRAVSDPVGLITELVGAAGYVSKPVDLEKVRSTVQQIVGPPPAEMVH